MLSPILEKWCLCIGPVFKDRHGFNKKIRNGRRHVKIFPAGGDLIIPPRKISFYGSIQKEKGGAMPGAKLGPMLGENCPEATPTPRRFWRVFH